MDKKTKFAIGFAAVMTVEAFARGWKINYLRKKNAELIKQNEILTEGCRYFQGVALAAFKRLPVSALEDMQFDIDFVHIATKENL